MRILLIGNGKMGREIRLLAESRGHRVTAALNSEATAQNAAVFDADGNPGRTPFDEADVVIDFSSPSALPAVAGYVRRTGTPLVCGTTGYSAEQAEVLRRLGEAAPVLYSVNYSMGVAVMKRILRDCGAYLLNGGFDAELVETHHRQKADAPSGTAKALLEALDPAGELEPVYGRHGLCRRGTSEIGVHVLRGGTEAGTHSVQFFGEDEMLEVRHSAASRSIFARGALYSAERLAGRGPGYYTFEQLLFDETEGEHR